MGPFSGPLLGPFPSVLDCRLSGLAGRFRLPLVKAPPSQAAPPPSYMIPQPTPEAERRPHPPCLETDYVSDDPCDDPILFAELLHDPEQEDFPEQQDNQPWTTIAELNTTFVAIVQEAEAQLANPEHSSAPAHIAIAVPRYQRARLLGEEQVKEVAAVYLAEASNRLRSGSYKSVRFAFELLTSHAGERKLGDLTEALGKEVLGYVARLSPNIRKYSQAQGASLAELATLSEEHESVSLTAQTQRRIWRQLQQFLDWCVRSGTLEANPWEGLQVKERPEVQSHRVLSAAQISLLLNANDRVLHSALLFCLLTGMRSGEACGLLAEDISTKGISQHAPRTSSPMGSTLLA